MRYYHGTISKGLETLIPFANPDNNIQKHTVYLTANPALAALYIWNRPYKWLTYHMNSEGIPVYTESFKDSLKEFYSGVSGVIYESDEIITSDEDAGILTTVVLYKPVKIKVFKEVSDVYEYILELERSGEIIINRYDELTERQIESNKKMVANYINSNKFSKIYSDFIQEKFSEIWIECKEVN